MSNLLELINNIKKYHQPIEWEIVQQIYNTNEPKEDYKQFSWRVLENNNKYNKLYDLLDDYYKNYDEIKKLVYEMALEETLKIEFFKILRNGKIIDNNNYDEEVPEGLYRCDNCGNIWDGFAQCDCSYRYLIYFD
jgi:rubrerythrin